MKDHFITTTLLVGCIVIIVSFYIPWRMAQNDAIEQQLNVVTTTTTN